MSDERKTILLRAYLVYVLVVLFAIVIVIQIIRIQFVQGEYWRKKGNSKTEIKEVIYPVKGNIYADDGSLLSTSVPVFQVNLDLDSTAIHDSVFNKYVDSLGICLSIFFEQTPKNKQKYIDDLKQARDKKVRNYVLIRNVDYYGLKKVKKFPILRKGKYGGLNIIKKYRRVRPFKNLASMTIGYERLSDFKVKIQFDPKNIPQEKFDRYADTLSFCFANTFNDYGKEYYKKLLTNIYQNDEQHTLTKTMNEIQLEEMLNFPLINESFQTKLDFEDLIDSLFSKKKENVKLGNLLLTKLTNSYYVGLEGYYRNILRGKKGMIIKRKVGTNSWQEISDADVIKPINGCDLYTTIDVNLQDVAQNALRRSLDTTHADWGCVILMEVKTGYIKAIANLTKTKDGTYKELRNYAYKQQFEPGSTLKLASVIAVLEDGVYDTNYIVNSGTIQYNDYGKPIVDSHKEGYGRISVAKAFEKSSNVGITEITRKAFRGDLVYTTIVKDGKKTKVKVDPKLEKFKKYIANMGLLKRTGIDLYNETGPYFPITREDLTAIAFGYSIKLTPLQVLSLYNAVANDGKYMKPKIVKEIRNNGIVLYKNKPEVLIQNICSQSTIQKVKKLLEGVVERGTATNIKNSVYKIAGKTGTAKIWASEIGGEEGGYVASFCGYFPADNPMYSCIVVEYNMKGGEIYGSRVAAPVFKEIADKVYATRADIKAKDKNIPKQLSLPQMKAGYSDDVQTILKTLNINIAGYKGETVSEWIGLKKSDISVVEIPMKIEQGNFPDILGMAAKDATFLLEKKGYNVIVKGAGKVSNYIHTNKNGKNYVTLILST